MPKKHLRSDQFLVDKLNQVWSQYFSDITKSNPVHIRFGRKAPKRLGSIRRCNIDNATGTFDTLILINGHYRDPSVPSYIVEATITHELCHYAHGFSSPFAQLSRFPHRGGIIDKEMQKRNLASLVNSEKKWLNSQWLKFIDKQKP